MVRHLRLVTQDPVWTAESDTRRCYVVDASRAYPEAVRRGRAYARWLVASQIFLRSRRDVPAGYRFGGADRVTDWNNQIEDRPGNDPNIR